MKSLRKAAFGSDGLRAMAANQNNAPNEDGSVKRKDRNGYKRRSRDRDGQNQKRKGGPLASSNTINTPFAPGYRIKVGYVSANIKAKTTVYMAQDLFQFHNRDLFEVHVYATTPQVPYSTSVLLLFVSYYFVHIAMLCCHHEHVCDSIDVLLLCVYV